MKKTAATIVILFFMILLFANGMKEFSSAEGRSFQFTDSCGRTVQIPEGVTKVAVSGNVAAMLMESLAPEYMVNINSRPTEKQLEFLPDEVAFLPVTGNLYGGKTSINLEQLMTTGAQLIIDAGQKKNTASQDMDLLQEKTGLPCIFLEADILHLAETFRSLGTILKDKSERAEKLAVTVEKILALAQENSLKIKEDDKLKALVFGASETIVFAEGAPNASVLDILGVENAYKTDNVVNKGNTVNAEQLYILNPDVMIFTEEDVYSKFIQDKTYSRLKAVENNMCFVSPSLPFCWIGQPPSVNMLWGVLWLGNLLYPQYYYTGFLDMLDGIFRQ